MSLRLALTALVFMFMLPNIVFADDPELGCTSGSIIGNPPIGQVPTYDYGPDGLLQYHFRFTVPEWNYSTLRVLQYDDNCNLIQGRSYGQVNGSYLPPVRNLLVKVTEFNKGQYNFKVYDEDTGQFQGGGLGYVPNDFNAPKIALKLINPTGSYYFPSADIVNTPAAWLHNTSVVPSRNPILIIPGAMGTELYNEHTLLWPNITKMFTDVNDNFLDSMAFTSDLKSIIQTISYGDLIKNPFPGEHYYDSLIQSLVSAGMKENQDFFTFPYDWRYGISNDIVSSLVSRISALAMDGKVDVIAHSTGGLLLKKAAAQMGSQYIDKAIMVGVPNYGSAKALKTLIFGDNLGVPWLDSDKIKEISKNFPLMYDLSPSNEYVNQYQSYFNDMSHETASSYLSGYYNLNTKALSNANTLHSSSYDNMDLTELGIQTFNIVGCGVSTLSKLFEVKQPSETFDIPFPVQKIFITGDGTVPVFSAVGSNHNNYYVLNPDHGKLPGQPEVSGLISSILTNSSYSSSRLTTDPNQCPLKGKIVSIFGNPLFKIKSAGGDLLFASSKVNENVSGINVYQQPNVHIVHFERKHLNSTIEIDSNDSVAPVNVQISNLETVNNNLPDNHTVFLDIFKENKKTALLTKIDEDIPVIEQVPVAEVISSGGSSQTKKDRSIIIRKRKVKKVKGASTANSPAQSNQAPHKEGSLINFGKTVFLVEKGQRRGFRSYGEFLSHGYVDIQIEPGNNSDWVLPEGLLMLAKPQTLATDSMFGNKIFLINNQFERQWISSEKMLHSLMVPGQQIFQINLTDYRAGNQI